MVPFFYYCDSVYSVIYDCIFFLKNAANQFFSADLECYAFYKVRFCYKSLWIC